jgi:hypothetical protein
MNEFINPWLACPSCHQYYQNEIAIDIATEFVSFVQRQYPRDTQRQVESLYVKLHALMHMFERLQPRQKRELGVTADVLLSLIDRMKGDASSPLPRRYSRFEADAYGAHGKIVFKREQKQGGQWLTLRTVLKLTKQLAMMMVLRLQLVT